MAGILQLCTHLVPVSILNITDGNMLTQEPVQLMVGQVLAQQTSPGGCLVSYQRGVDIPLGNCSAQKSRGN